jgi:phosphoribosylanthranilate isomerase
VNALKVKICGITEKADALKAVELGADVLGFIFAPSPRQISMESARRIIEAIPPFVKTVGVFVNEAMDVIGKHVNYCGLDLVQLHGDESPQFCRELMPRTIKAVRIKDVSSLPDYTEYQANARALLLDTYVRGKAGGTGQTFDWRLAVKIRESGMPVILSGGLGPANIEEAVREVRPYAVDVNSGIEERPGKKSFVLMEELMMKVSRTDRKNIERRTSKLSARKPGSWDAVRT